MDSKLKLLKIFEGFHKTQIDNLSKNGSTYVGKVDRILKDYKAIKYGDVINDIRTYDYSKFEYKQKPYGLIEVKPDREFMNLFLLLCEVTNNDNLYEPNLKFDLEIRLDGSNRIEFPNGLPSILRGLSVGYNLYILVVNHNKYISSDNFASTEAINLWYNLLQNESCYAITSKKESYLIDKNMSDIDLSKLIKKIYKSEFIMDDDLNNKVKILNLI